MWWKGKYSGSGSDASRVDRWTADDYSWSPSRSVSSFFDTSFVSSRKKDDQREALNNILAEATRTANMLSNSQTGEEQSIKVVFSDGKPTEYTQNSFVIEPSMVMTEGGSQLKSGSAYYDALDALNGRVIIGSQIRRNVTKEEYDTFAASEDGSAKQTFQAMQESIAYSQINSDWPGFRAYTMAHAKATHLHKDSLQDFYPTDLVDKQITNIVMAANYNMLNPDDPIVTGNADIDNVIADYNDRLGNTFQSVKEATDWLRSQLKNTAPPSSKGKNPSAGDDGKSDDKGNPEPQPGDKGEGKDDKDGKEGANVIPDVFDNKLLSPKPIETTMPELAAIKGESGDVCNIDGFKSKEWSKEKMLQRNRAGDEAANQAAYNEFCKTHKQAIKEIENCFLFEDTVPDLYSRGLTDGDLDENNLWKVACGDYEYIHESKDIPRKPQHCLGILLDQSGSMSGGKIAAAREVLMLLIEGLDAYPTIKKVVYGFTAQTGGCFTDSDMLPYIKPGIDNRHLIAGAAAICNNIDGLAIHHIAKEICNINDVDNRYLFVISDGQPSGYEYDGNLALNHTAKCVQSARKRGIKVFGIGIQNAYSDDIGRKLYGDGNFIVLRDVASSLKILVRKIKEFLQQA